MPAIIKNVLHKTAHRISIGSIFLLHLLFLGSIIWDRAGNYWLIPFFLVSVFLVATNLAKSNKTSQKLFQKREILQILGCTGGALVTFWLKLEFDFGAVLAAGLVGLVAGILPRFFRPSPILGNLPLAIYCGAFVGMTAENVAGGYSFIFSAGLLTGIIMMLAKNSLNGYGGKLGTIAFGGVCIAYSIIFLFELA